MEVQNTGFKSGSVSEVIVDTKSFDEYPDVQVSYVRRNKIPFMETKEVIIQMLVTHHRNTRYMEWDAALYDNEGRIIDKFRAVNKGSPPEKPDSCE